MRRNGRPALRHPMCRVRELPPAAESAWERITYAAAVVEIEVNKDTGVVVAKHVYGAMDCGLAVNPAIVESQIVGMSIHGASLALKEEVAFDRTHVTSIDWNSYPV